MQQPHPQQPSQPGPEVTAQDALGYLSQVKMYFPEHSSTYLRFLDVMKDFKANTIDTPAVIEAVSQLFRGHQTLISGFNSFLPPGYRFVIF